MELRLPRFPSFRIASSLPLLVLATAGIGNACAYTVTIGVGAKAAYLRVGDGTITGAITTAAARQPQTPRSIWSASPCRQRSWATPWTRQ